MDEIRGGKDMGAQFVAEVERNARLHERALVWSIWDVEHWRKGQLLSYDSTHNIVPNDALDNLLNVHFHAATQITTWYVLIFESNTTPSSATTYATPVFTESTAYDEATRPEYKEAAASGQSMTNSANKADFTMNATKTIYGAALVGGGTDADTKGDAAGGGTLYCAAKFSASKAVEDDDILHVTVTLTAADDGV